MWPFLGQTVLYPTSWSSTSCCCYYLLTRTWWCGPMAEDPTYLSHKTWRRQANISLAVSYLFTCELSWCWKALLNMTRGGRWHMEPHSNSDPCTRLCKFNPSQIPAWGKEESTQCPNQGGYGNWFLLEEGNLPWHFVLATRKVSDYPCTACPILHLQDPQSRDEKKLIIIRTTLSPLE